MRRLIFSLAAVSLVLFAEKALCRGSSLAIEQESFNSLSYQDFRVKELELRTRGTGRFLSVDPVLDIDRAMRKPQGWNRYAYVENNPINATDPTGKILDTIADIGFIGYDLFDIGRSIYRGEGVSGTQGLALGADILGAVIPFATGGGAAVRVAAHADDAVDAVRVVSNGPDAARLGTAGGERAGKSFTPKGKQEIHARNADANAGANKCQTCGTTVAPGQKSQRGVTPPGNQREADHIVPKSKGGDGSPSNGQTLCRTCNQEKAAKCVPGVDGCRN